MLILAGCAAKHSELEQDSNVLFCLGACAQVDSKSKSERDSKELNEVTIHKDETEETK